ncbi:DMT family transporter [Nocardia camponoti]|uniref:Multidrug resistance protein Mmr n=1 Tax=Nocardia camponoti TaxID=1616106 RepID=A0A917VF32_9NOCA|nr:multidrug efflux SMR transporter [Nocardia camponoti]GGK68287.1 quaternary ammonium compound-resistance protein SugE [Nocardia camponoti]
MAWLYLLIAAVFEVVFALATNASEGFTVLGPSLLTAAAAAAGIFFLSLALRTLDVGVGYTVWTGIGSVGTVVFATLFFGESLSAGKVLAFLLIIGGVLGLKLADTVSGHAAEVSAPDTHTAAAQTA